MNSNLDLLEIQAYTTKAVGEKVALLVLGMHRSGTSALANILALAGAALPQQMIEAGEGNETGHWEPKRIALINDEVLEALNHTWLDWAQLDLDLLPSEHREAFEQDIRRLLVEEYDDAPLIVVKEPRICRMANTYIQALDDLGYRTVPVIIYRNPLEVIDSLMARTSWPERRTSLDAALLWLNHVLEAEIATRGIDRTFLAYENLFDEWQNMLASLAKRADIDFPVKDEELARQVRGFLDPAQRHQIREPADLSDEPAAMGWVQKTLNALHLLSDDPQSTHAAIALDEVRADIQSAAPMLQLSLRERENLYDKLQDEEYINQGLRSKIQMLDSEVESVSLARDVWNRRTTDLEQEKIIFQEELRAMLNSHSWRITAPLRGIRRGGRAIFQRLSTIRATITARGGLLSTVKLAYRVASNDGIRSLFQRFEQGHATRIGAVMFLHDGDGKSDFVNSVVPRRRDVLLSDWHVNLIGAIADQSPLSVEGPTLGLSLVTHNSARWLPGFFNTLREQNFPLKRLNVIFVDNGSTDDTVRLIEAESEANGDLFASFSLHRHDNLGFGVGHDHAIRQCNDEFVLVSNVDIAFHPNTISQLWRAAMADADDVASWEARQCPYEHPKYYDPVTLEPSWSSHACILIRRRAYEDVGGYDKKIFMYGEDVELSYRFRGRGWRLRYLPQISVTHFVDLIDTSLRPHQLSGSVAANVLLRHRYGGPDRVAEGDELLAHTIENEESTQRRIALAKAQAKIAQDRQHFSENHKPAADAAFPFREFDYDVTRYGHNVELQSADPVYGRPLVSVITRTYGNKLGQLSEALASVINQSYPNIEHIIVEDRTDFAEPMTTQVRETYRRNLRYLKSNGAGRSRAGNFGLENARGDYLMFLDNDDLIFGDHIELLVRGLSSHPDHVASYALAWEARTEYMADGAYREISFSAPESHRLEFNRARLRDMNFIPIQCIMFRREVYEAEGGFDEEIDHLEDWNLWSRYSHHGDFNFIQKLTSLYRTPADDSIRLQRQTELDAAYQSVKQKNLIRFG